MERPLDDGLCPGLISNRTPLPELVPHSMPTLSVGESSAENSFRWHVSRRMQLMARLMSCMTSGLRTCKEGGEVRLKRAD